MFTYGKRIAIMKNGNVMTEINKLQLEKYCIEYDDNRLAMQALMNDEVDFAIMRQTVATVLLRELKAAGIEGYVSIGQSDMCFGINNAEPELVVKINSVLEKLKINGMLDYLQSKWLTTFIRPYTVKEILSKNIWLVFIFFVLFTITFAVFVKTEFQKKKDKEEKIRNAQVVEWLTKDFTCVNYVKITDDPDKDTVINYRVSERLKQIIPGWENEKYFLHKLNLLCDNLVYEPDSSSLRKMYCVQR